VGEILGFVDQQDGIAALAECLKEELIEVVNVVLLASIRCTFLAALAECLKEELIEVVIVVLLALVRFTCLNAKLLIYSNTNAVLVDDSRVPSSARHSVVFPVPMPPVMTMKPFRSLIP
jgi:hypothetical protein